MRLSVACALILIACCGPVRGQNACLNYTGFVASGGLDLWGITAGQLNDDTLLDMAVSNHLTADISIFFGNGDGTFQPAVTLPVGPYPVDIVAADLNFDELDDLVIAGPGQAQVLLNLGGGSFDAPVSYTIPPGDTWTLLAHDLDNDEFIDLLVPHGAGGGGLAVFQGNGDGSFQPFVDYPTDVTPTSLALADFDQDDDLDVLYTHLAGFGEVVHFWSILWGVDPGSFGNRTHVDHPRTSIYASALDINEDGYSDVVVSDSWPDSLSFCMGHGTDIFDPPVSFFGAIGPSLTALADMDLDGHQDLLVADYAGNSFFVHPGDGNGDFPDHVSSLAAVDPIDFAVGRFNADAYPDIVISDSQGAYVGVILSCLIAGVEEVDAASLITLGPNPADEELHIHFKGAVPGGWIAITDAAGRRVGQAISSSPSLLVDTAPLAMGLYVASLHDAHDRVVERARFEVLHQR